MAALPEFRLFSGEKPAIPSSPTVPPDASAAPLPSAELRPRRRGKPQSIGVKLGVDGKADVSAMKPEQVSKLREAISGTSLLSSEDKKREAELKKSRIESYKPLVTPIYKLVGSLEALMMAKARKCSIEQAKLFHYSDSEIEMLEGPTAAVLEKHCGTAEKYIEEVTLLIFLSSIWHEKAIAFNEAVAKAKLEELESKKRSAVLQDADSLNSIHAIK
jgi:hypothetical protein